MPFNPNEVEIAIKVRVEHVQVLLEALGEIPLKRSRALAQHIEMVATTTLQEADRAFNAPPPVPEPVPAPEAQPTLTAVAADATVTPATPEVTAQ